MKKLLSFIGLTSLLSASCFGELLSANVVGVASATPAYVLTTNRAAVYNVEVTSAYGGTVNLYDSDGNTTYFSLITNSIIPSNYWYRTSYATNYVTSYVGYNGYTNWYTNAGLWSLNVTNTAQTTNVTPPLASFVFAPNTYAVYAVDALFVRGIAATATTNVSIVINYRSGK